MALATAVEPVPISGCLCVYKFPLSGLLAMDLLCYEAALWRLWVVACWVACRKVGLSVLSGRSAV